MPLLRSPKIPKPNHRMVDETAQSREFILKFLLIFTLGWLVAAVVILCVGMLTGLPSLWPRLIATGLVVAIMSTFYVLAQKGYARTISYVLVALYLLIVVGAYMMWGINNLQALLLAAFVVIISGILISARYALYVAAFVVALMFYVNSAFDQTVVIDNVITAANIVFLGVILGLIAMVSWLFNDQMERSLKRAERSEAALIRQKGKLEELVEERTRKLQAMQMEQMQQVYRFAELGILSTALLHDLANHLNTISADIDGLSKKNSSHILSRIKGTIGYIDTSVSTTRRQLEGTRTIKRFKVIDATQEVVELLTYKAQQADVQLKIVTDQRPSLSLTGDMMRFKQLLTNLINNAIESYDKHHRDREVIISISANDRTLAISIADHGQGMTETQQKQIFQPFYTTKSKNMGLGLFIAKEIAENSFGGTLKIASDKGHGAAFAVKIPLGK